MKKIICIILVCMMLLSLVACQSNNQQATDASEENKGGYELNPKLIAKNTEGKTRLTLAAFVLKPDIEQRIIDFNTTNENYYIEVLDYYQYNTKEDRSAGHTKLNTDILGGNTPDMIELGKTPIEKYTNKGLLQDLNEFIDKDPEYRKEAFQQGAYAALSSKDGLYRLSPSMTLIGLYGKRSIIGTAARWNIDEMKKVLVDKKDVEYPFINMPPLEVLQSLTMYTLDNFIDRNNGTCSFDSKEFMQLLETVKTLGQSTQVEYLEAGETLKNNQGLLATFYLSLIDQYAKMDDELNGDMNLIGFPTQSGSGNIADFLFSFGMFSDSENKEGCWQFLRTLLDEEYQRSLSKSEIPLLNKIFDETLKKSSATEEQKSKYAALVNSITKISDFDGKLMKIIEEEAQQFIEGGRSAEDTAKAIQSRASIYLSESR